MAGKVKERHFAVVGEQLAHRFLEFFSREDVLRSSAHHQAGTEIDGTVSMPIQHGFHGAGVVNASCQGGDVRVMINSYDEGLPQNILLRSPAPKPHFGMSPLSFTSPNDTRLAALVHFPFLTDSSDTIVSTSVIGGGSPGIRALMLTQFHMSRCGIEFLNEWFDEHINADA